MLILQALLGFIRRSAGKVIESIFGWAVAALFGDVPKDQKTLLSAVVAGVAIWPVLLAGIVVPRVATFILALVPLPKHLPSGLLRTVWASLAVLVPVAVGLMLPRSKGVKRWRIRSVLDGFPMTVCLSAAFTLAFVGLPFQKLRSVLKGVKDEHVPLISEEASLDEVASAVRGALEAEGLGVEPDRAPWLARSLSAILRLSARLVGREANRTRFYRGPDLELTLSPQGATLRGAPRATARAHAAVSGVAVRTPALQTTDASSQKLERRIREIWKKMEREGGRSAARSLYGDLAREVGVLNCPYEDWEVLYRECLQLGLAVQGVADPVAEGASGPFESEVRRRRRLIRRARGFTRERAAASTAKGVLTLAQRVAQRILSGRALR